MIEITIAILLLIAMVAKKNTEPRWLQTTLDGGVTRGPMDWMSDKDTIAPDRFELSEAASFWDEGWTKPDWKHPLPDKSVICLIFSRDAPDSRPLMISQRTAMASVGNFISSTPGTWTQRGDIDIWTPTNPNWFCTFLKDKKSKYAGFQMGVEDDTPKE